MKIKILCSDVLALVALLAENFHLAKKQVDKLQNVVAKTGLSISFEKTTYMH